MPEKPEVITVAKRLKARVQGKTIKNVDVLWDNIIEGCSVEEFKNSLVNEVIEDVTTRGKWIVFHLKNKLLLVHLRMEGKFFYRDINAPIEKHQHVIFTLDDIELRFADVRKFGKMRIIPKIDSEKYEPFLSLGKEAWDKDLTDNYLLEKFKLKKLPIKTVLLDQSIITGIGNIYADEILFLSNINPLTGAKELTSDNRNDIIKNTIKVLDKAIEDGGTTIRSYTSEEGVIGNNQNNLYVHQRENENCRICNSKIIKIKVGGRGTYYCPMCQK